MTIKERALAQFPGSKEWGDHDDVTQSQRRAAYELGAVEEREVCIRKAIEFIGRYSLMGWSIEPWQDELRKAMSE